jgi:proline iminopeptidase
MGSTDSYFDQTGRDDVLSGGVRMITIATPSGPFRVWTKRVGNNPTLKVLLLHGGPGITHEYLEAFDSYLPGTGVEYYYYDQLGSGNSDHPDDTSLWDLDRFVDEVEQVRTALRLDRENFVLYGQSWGALLAMEYAVHHQQHLRGMILSNMMSSAPRYGVYAREVLMPQMDPTALAEIVAIEERGDFENPRFMELLNEHHYVHHVVRMPVDEWPEPLQRSFSRINPAIYVKMQGPSELGMSPDATLAHWDRTEDLASIAVPTLVIGATHDTMDPDFLRDMAARLPNGEYLHCPEGSHLSIYDDQETYFAGIIDFLERLPA